MEKELGLGIVMEVTNRNVRVQFPASNCERLYSISSAPLQRVRFKEHDTVMSRDGNKYKITFVANDNGIFIYHSDHGSISETDISDTISFTTAKERLLSGSVDENRKFNVRWQALQLQHEIRQSSVRGFIGGRVDLIPHQFYIAHEVTSRYQPRVLLSDEVGLGKTIESCLILHRLLITGRISRVLIIVPQTLLHQWFIELIRKFNLIFRIVDEEYCQSIKASEDQANPFLEDQLVMVSLDFLSSHDYWSQKAIDARWDMVVVDEVHYLTCGGKAYQLVKSLNYSAHGLMLLTATPMQLGKRNHFDRLQLLDPDRYFEYDQFEKEIENYQTTAKFVTELMASGQIDILKLNKFNPLLLSSMKSLISSLDVSRQNDVDIKNQIVEKIIDYYGTGRAIFRNSRSTISGFPKRIIHLIPLTCHSDYLQNLTDEFKHDLETSDDNVHYVYEDDPRIDWMKSLLKYFKQEKVLIICRSISKAKAIEAALRSSQRIKMAVFHEQLSLLQRDRNAAWFANDDGAQLLICSEIGSEGRNFQFSHHLILFDLPINPELLEQRIGRLDRIGQKNDIIIYVPYAKASEYEILARWYHEGLRSFENNVPGVSEIYQHFEHKIKDIALNRQFSKIDNFILQTKKMCTKVKRQLEKGRDQLLALNSFRPKIAERVIAEIVRQDEDNKIEKFMLKVFDIFGIRSDKVDYRTYHLNMALLKTPEFPLPPHFEHELLVTFDRDIANRREDIEFLSMDHPMVTGAIDLILGSEIGNCTAILSTEPTNEKIILETIYILECIADKKLQIDRFLPPTPIQIIVNHKGEEISAIFSAEKLNKRCAEKANLELLKSPHFRYELLPAMLQKSDSFAEAASRKAVNAAIKQMEAILAKEKARLVELSGFNANIGKEEILNYEKHIQQLNKILQSAQLRLDSLRLAYITNANC